MLFDEDGKKRLSVNRTVLTDDGQYQDGITWDELNRVKAEAGFADAWAIEIYPPTDDVVNVANMRHLWILDEAPIQAWTDGQP